MNGRFKEPAAHAQAIEIEIVGGPILVRISDRIEIFPRGLVDDCMYLSYLTRSLGMDFLLKDDLELVTLLYIAVKIDLPGENLTQAQGQFRSGSGFQHRLVQRIFNSTDNLPLSLLVLGFHHFGVPIRTVGASQLERAVRIDLILQSAEFLIPENKFYVPSYHDPVEVVKRAGTIEHHHHTVIVNPIAAQQCLECISYLDLIQSGERLDQPSDKRSGVCGGFLQAVCVVLSFETVGW